MVSGGRARAGAEAWASLHPRLLDRDGWRCRNPLCRSPRGLEIDHVVPRSQGGPDEEANLVTLCSRCHALKGASVLIVIPDGAGGFRFHDLRRVVVCEGCHHNLEAGESVWVPTPAGGQRLVRL